MTGEMVAVGLVVMEVVLVASRGVSPAVSSDSWSGRGVAGDAVVPAWKKGQSGLVQAWL
jgi:hypothetical protein